MSSFVEIDGSLGEGGGQVLRSSLALSIITKKPFRITNIRAKRSKPGLKAQHLTAITAARDICGASVEGDSLSSCTLSFLPDICSPGHYYFDIGTAGATSLVLHTIFLPLSFVSSESHIRIKGGTHVPFSPLYEYLATVWGSFINKTQGNMELNIEQAGFYPRGGGLIEATIKPITKIENIIAIEKPSVKKLTIHAIVGKLPEHVAQREIDTLSAFLRKNGFSCTIDGQVKSYRTSDSGNCLLLECELRNGITVGFSNMGKQGKSAEKVAEELGKKFMKYWKTKSVMDEHLADQALLPLVFAKEPSEFTVCEITQHLITNAEIIKQFTNAQINIHGKEGESGKVEITPQT